jgi:hypothetical protein
LTNNCNTVTPGQLLKPWQNLGLELISYFYSGRDVVIAIDLTESVGLNEEGRIRLTQIIKDSLQSGDTVYVVPFASEVNPLAPNINPISLEQGIEFHGKPEDIDRILQAVPFQSEITATNTDIQKAELFIYEGLARVNQCRLTNDRAIKPQSVVWLTDAPLLTSSGITSDTWVETPANSLFRLKNSQESKVRESWIKALPLKERSRQIEGNNNTVYQLSVVDSPPTVQEFCTPAPGGKETCLVTPYLIKLLWLPTSVFILVLVVSGIWVKYLISVNQKWKLKISFDSDDSREEQICYLKNKQRITIGDESLNGIKCPGEEVRGYLFRQGNQIYLQPTKTAPIFYRDREVTKKEKITGNYFKLNCPRSGLNPRDFEIAIRIIR